MNTDVEAERKPRFALDPAVRRTSGQRAASQPARNEGASGPATPLLPGRDPAGDSYGSNGNGVWGSPLRADVGDQDWPPRVVPARSASFSVAETHPHHDAVGGKLNFPSTFEDDEEDLGEGEEEEQTQPGKSGLLTPRDTFSRSRSQSMANEALRGHHSATLPPPGSSGLARNWQEHTTDPNVGEYEPELQRGSRHSSLSPVRRVTRASQELDLSNMSPFHRDVGQILMDDPPPLREPWGPPHGAGGNWREDNGGGSGTTSRRHSVSVVQPRRAVAGFVVPGDSEFGFDDDDGEGREGNKLGLGTFGTGALRISDEDLISGLGAINLQGPPSALPRTSGHSQPSSLPAYAPTYRSYGTSPVAPLSPDSTVGSFSSRLGQSGTRTHLRPYPLARAASFGTTTSADEGRSAHSRGDSPSRAQEMPMNGGRHDATFVAAPRSSSGNAMRPLDIAGRSDPYRADAGYMPPSPVDYAASPLSRMYQSGFVPPPVHLPPVPRLHTAIVPVAARSPLSPSAPSFARSGQQPHYSHASAQSHHRQSVDPTSPTLSDMGRGVPLHSVPNSDPLYIVEFKAGRTDIYYCPDQSLVIRVGDLVIVEADRGKDLGKVVNDSISLADVEAFQKQASDPNQLSHPPTLAGTRDAYLAAALSGPLSPGSSGPLNPALGGVSKPAREIMPKRIYAKAQPQETQLLLSKMHDEAKALQLCQNKVRQKRLPMEVVDAEFQWDRRKLTFYFVADKRIDFRELVRELFRLYKTRIWMACLGENVGDFVG